MRGPASMRRTARRTRGRCDGNRDRGRTSTARRARPASSTPVGPPPMTAKLRSSLASHRVLFALGELEGREHTRADGESVVDRLEPRRDLLPGLVSEVRRLGAASENEKVPREDRAVDQVHLPPGQVDSRRFAHQDGDVCLRSDNRADRLGDLGRRQARARHLVEEGLKRVVVGAVEKRDSHRRAREGLRCGQAAETSAEDEDVRARVLRLAPPLLPGPCLVPKARARQRPAAKVERA